MSVVCTHDRCRATESACLVLWFPALKPCVLEEVVEKVSTCKEMAIPLRVRVGPPARAVAVLQERKVGDAARLRTAALPWMGVCCRLVPGANPYYFGGGFRLLRSPKKFPHIKVGGPTTNIPWHGFGDRAPLHPAKIKRGRVPRSKNTFRLRTDISRKPHSTKAHLSPTNPPNHLHSFSSLCHKPTAQVAPQPHRHSPNSQQQR